MGPRCSRRRGGGGARIAPRFPSRARAIRRVLASSTPLLLVASSAFSQRGVTRAGPATALTVGETFTLESKTLGEVRRINVYRPPSYADSADSPRPVLYMPDGGIGED